MEEREDGDKSKLGSDTYYVGINGITSNCKVSQRQIFTAHDKGEYLKAVLHMVVHTGSDAK